MSEEEKKTDPLTELAVLHQQALVILDAVTQKTAIISQSFHEQERELRDMANGPPESLEERKVHFLRMRDRAVEIQASHRQFRDLQTKFTETVHNVPTHKRRSDLSTFLYYL